ncbi:hypothetical protein DPMN_036777 [Dreissena polymorpha]|uniref:Uncharacterized protein n=1 Tax=Dreissena polymorpha TaxID=45954 RepID=A0A9D4RP66_DREPO|nr:hypothetical protein DPMN_036777 [Dreissena polymorpha]
MAHRHALAPVRIRHQATEDSTVLDRLLTRKCVPINCVQCTATGQIGPRGQVARLPAMWDLERRQEPALILNQNDLVITVMAMLASIQCAKETLAIIQYTAVGQIGPRGQVAQLPVTWDLKRGQEPVLIRNQTETGTFVSEIPSRIQFVLQNHAATEVNGGWSYWGSWESCSATCGVGLKLRSRNCTNPIPLAYGKTCEGDFKDSAMNSCHTSNVY